MSHNLPPDDDQVLPDRVADRLLTRASELDAVREGGAPVADLRAAATEAGISARSFDAALAEMQRADQAKVPAARVRTRSRRPLVALVLSIAALIGLFAVGRILGPKNSTSVAEPLAEEAFVLRCLSAEQAAEIARPLLSSVTSTVMYSARAPGVLTVRATPAQIQTVRAALDKYEGAGSGACTKPD